MISLPSKVYESYCTFAEQRAAVQTYSHGAPKGSFSFNISGERLMYFEAICMSKMRHACFHH